MTLYQLQLLLALTKLAKGELGSGAASSTDWIEQWNEIDKIEQEVRHEAGLSTHVDKPTEPEKPAPKAVDHWMGKPITDYTKEELATILIQLNHQIEQLRKENLQYIRSTYLYNR